MLHREERNVCRGGGRSLKSEGKCQTANEELKGNPMRKLPVSMGLAGVQVSGGEM
jgi:hypothetical protein